MVTDHYVDEFEREYPLFRDDYRVAMGTTPVKMDFYGYDTINLVLRAISNGGTNRDSFVNQLKAVSNFAGMKGGISLKGGSRSNSEIIILRYSEGTFQKLR